MMVAFFGCRHMRAKYSRQPSPGGHLDNLYSDILLTSETKAILAADVRKRNASIYLSPAL